MKLFYFGLKGRAETARVMLRVGGVEFEDVIFTGEEWGTKYKAQSPSGQCPWLEVDDGKLLSQSSAINLYCAGKAGFMPSDPFQVARTIELTNHLEDVWVAVAATFKIKDAEEKVAARKTLCEPEGTMTKKMEIIEALVAGSKTEFYCGEQATLADFHLFTWLGLVRSGFLDGITKEYMDGFEKTAALRTKVASMPKVKELYADAAGFEP